MDNLDYLPLTVGDMQLLTPEQAWHYRVIPKLQTEKSLTFFAEDRSGNDAVAEELEMIFGKQVILEWQENDLIQRRTYCNCKIVLRLMC